MLYCTLMSLIILGFGLQWIACKLNNLFIRSIVFLAYATFSNETLSEPGPNFDLGCTRQVDFSTASLLWILIFYACGWIYQYCQYRRRMNMVINE